MAELRQRFYTDLGRTKRKLRALRSQHPGRNSESAAIGTLAYRKNATATLLSALSNWQRLAKKRMPTIVDRDGCWSMGIM